MPMSTANNTTRGSQSRLCRVPGEPVTRLRRHRFGRNCMKNRLFLALVLNAVSLAFALTTTA
jgi:hypothetical protein